MQLFQVAVALSIPWLAGALTVRTLWRGSVAGAWGIALGYGYFLGLSMVVLLLRLQMRCAPSPDWRAPTLVLTFVCLVSAGVLLQRGGGNCSIRIGWRNLQPSSNYWERGLCVLLLAWLGWRLALLAQELWLRPVYPWDAWSTWEVRARVWAELQHWAAFVNPEQWIGDRTTYAVHAWEYPYAVSLIALWPTLAFGAWHEPIAHLPWLGLGIALGLGFYGQLRYWGASPLTALIGVWLLLSLPLLDTHLALAGYADLWLAATFGLSACALLQWARAQDSWQGWLALCMALVSPWIKREGLVWIALLLPAAAMVWIPRRYWLLLIGVIFGALVTWWLGGGVVFTVPGWGEVRLTPQALQIPVLGRFVLQYHDVSAPLANNVLVLANWHVLGYLVIVALCVNLRYAASSIWRGVGMGLTSAGLLLLFLLFFCTEAYVWATQYTSINRIFLQFTPLLLFWALINLLGEDTPPLLTPPPAL